MGVGHLAVGLALKRADRKLNAGWLIFAALLPDFLLGCFALAAMETYGWTSLGNYGSGKDWTDSRMAARLNRDSKDGFLLGLGDQLARCLETTKAPLEGLVVNRAERPGEN